MVIRKLRPGENTLAVVPSFCSFFLFFFLHHLQSVLIHFPFFFNISALEQDKITLLFVIFCMMFLTKNMFSKVFEAKYKV